MVEFKLVINDVKNGKSYSKVANEQESSIFKGKKIRDAISGSNIGLKGYELEVTGGSDKQGFPMRYDLDMMGRKRILLTKGPCVKVKRKGMRKRKTVRGNKLSTNISQINLKVIKYGEKKLEEVFGKKEEVKEEVKEKPKEVSKEAKKEAPKEEEKVEEKKSSN